MKDDERLLDEVGDLIGGFFVGLGILWVLWLALQLYILLTAVFWAILTEILWPMLRLILVHIGTTLLRMYNRVSRIVLGLD